MKNKKRFILMAVLGMFVVFNYSSVYAALGLSPALTEIDFQPELKFLSTFGVAGASAEQKLEVYAEGDFAEYVKFDKTTLIGQESFTAYVDLPKEAEKPGKNRLYIKVSEAKDSQGGVGVRLEIGALIVIRVPYPGKYAEIKHFTINDVNEKEPVHFDLNVESLGQESIFVKTNVEVYSNNEKIDSFSLGSKEIKPQTSGSFTKIIEKGYDAGIYNATVVVDYGEKITQTREFKIGKLFIEIINWSSRFEKGKINEFIIGIESKWNNDISGIYAEVNVSKNGVEVDYFKTPSLELKRWEKLSLKGFFNAENLESGTYDAKIVVFYDGEKTEKDIEIKVFSPGNTMMIVLIVGGIIIILIFITIIYLSIRKRKKKK